MESGFPGAASRRWFGARRTAAGRPGTARLWVPGRGWGLQCRADPRVECYEIVCCVASPDGEEGRDDRPQDRVSLKICFGFFLRSFARQIFFLKVLT